jgi:dTDP-4-dehydrorhamnose reductase
MVEFFGHQLKIVITGGNGLLGQTFQKVMSRNLNYSVKPLRKEELDVSDKKSLYTVLDNLRPDWLINCAAITNVDKAEINPSEAFLVNAIAVSNIAEVANQLNLKVLHFSTDYVFDGDATVPYLEISETNPVNQYGLSKLEGERVLLEAMPQNAVVVRTAWLYGSTKLGFLSDLIRRVEQRESEIQLVNDQIGQLTLASDVVLAAIEIINRFKIFESQIYHITNQNFGSWLEIGEFVNITLKGNTRMLGISHIELNRPALRPNFSALNSKKFAGEFFGLRTWTSALEGYLVQHHTGISNEPS